MTSLEAHHRMLAKARFVEIPPRRAVAEGCEIFPHKNAESWLRGPAHRAALDAHDRMQMACRIQAHERHGWNK